MVRNLFLIMLAFLLIVLIGFSLYGFTQFYQTLNKTIFKIGFFIIISFTFLISFRYLLLLFFSILNVVKNTADIDDKNFPHLKVSIIVPAFNEEVIIAKSIKSLLLQDYPNFEIIVVDDGSKDNTFNIAKKFQITGKVKVFRKRNGGKANAINFGIEKSDANLIMVVDADSRLNKNALTLLVKHFKDPQIAAVAGSVYVANQENILTKLQALEYIEGLNMVRNGQAFLKAVNIIPGPIGIFRKDALYEVGLYDQDTFAEDCDVTLKLIAKGKKIDFEPDAIAYTEVPDNLLDLIKQRYRWTRGILQAIRKHRNLLFNFKTNLTASIVMWYMLFEAIFWPFADIWVNMFIIYISFSQGVSSLLFYWWSLFTIIDLAGALYCVLITGEKLSLVFYALLYRLFFIEIINIAKILATFEEFFGVKMSWGKLERKGNI